MSSMDYLTEMLWSKGLERLSYHSYLLCVHVVVMMVLGLQ
jgi:hypothetical protein